MWSPRLLLPALLAALAVLLSPAPAGAQDTMPADVARSLLQDDPVYVDPDATAQVDEDVLSAEIGRSSRQIYVAVLPQAAADAYRGRQGVLQAIGRGLPNGSVLFTVTGDELGGGSTFGSGLAPGEADRIAVSNDRGGTTCGRARSSRGSWP